MADKAFITPKLLAWARESAKISQSAAAQKIQVNVEKIIEWEQGLTQPTIFQAESLAKLYRRPFAIFFLPNVPIDFKLLEDFRRKFSKDLSTSSIFIIREIQEKQNWISNNLQENEEQPLPFVGKYDLNASPEEVADDIIHTFNIDPTKYSNTSAPIKDWIDRAEALGIFISRTSFIHSRLKLDSDEFQGFVIVDKFAPFIFINTDDWKTSQLFTLVHELVHIWIDKSGISSDIEIDHEHIDQFNPIEVFCSEVAARILIPSSYMESVNGLVFDSLEGIFQEAKKLGVSSLAYLVRAMKLGKISIDTYNRLKYHSNQKYEAFLKKEEEKKLKGSEKKKNSGPSHYLLLLLKNGKLFTQIVIDGYRGGVISPTQASSLLNTKINKFYKFENLLYK